MDPASAISLAGSVVSIIDVLTRTIKSLHDLHERWKEADLTVTLLISQLSTLKAALNQIADWISDLCAGPQHYQLIIDLELSISSCNLLVNFMDHLISELKWNGVNMLDYRSRVQVVLQDKATKNCIKHLDTQTNALNLLLTAFNCRTQSEQKELLEGQNSRQVFQQVKDDSSSLVVLYDSASIFSNSTDSSSKLSMKFVFDGEILKSTVYQKTMRSLVRRIKYRGKRTDAGSIGSQTTDEIGQADRPVLGIIRETSVTITSEPVSDDDYICTVINLPLVEQTRRTRIFERPLYAVDPSQFWMPALPWRCIEFLNHHGLGKEDLYRTSESMSKLKYWQRRFDRARDVNLIFESEPELCDAYTISSVLQAWFRELPGEIFPGATGLDISELGNSEHEITWRWTRLIEVGKVVPQMLRDQLSRLPPFNYYLLRKFSHHFSLLYAHSDLSLRVYNNLRLVFESCVKLDRWYFYFMVCDWNYCWQGCWAEEEALKAELDIMNARSQAPQIVLDNLN